MEGLFFYAFRQKNEKYVFYGTIIKMSYIC